MPFHSRLCRNFLMCRMLLLLAFFRHCVFSDSFIYSEHCFTL